MKTALASLALVLGALLLAHPPPALAAPDPTCPKCRRTVGGDFLYCPYDGADLPEPACATCGRVLRREWRFCPFDGGAAAGPAPAPSPSPAPAPAPSPAPAPLVETLPRPGGVSDDDEPQGASGNRVHNNPIDTIDSLFRAITAGDEAWIRRLYVWEKFFPAEATEATRAQKVAVYIRRLIERVRPTLDGTERVPVHIGLAKSDATIKVALRDRATRAVSVEYEFKLVLGPEGWRIVGIKP